MAFQYIEAPNYEEIQNKESVFLGGGITGCFHWQNEVVDSLKEFDHLTVINPRRSGFEEFKSTAHFAESKKQIEWEFKYLRLAKQVVFWFSYETVQPIALFELGATLERGNQELYVGIDENYIRKFDLEVQLNLKGYHYPIRNSFEMFKEILVIQQRNYINCRL